MVDNKRVYKAPALEKGLEILELLAEKQIPLTMSEIANELGRSHSEIFRMLSVLEQKKYLEKLISGDKYGVTNHLFELGMKIPPASTLLELILPLMHKLANQTTQSCHLAIRSSDRFVVIARIESPSPIGVSVRVGLSKLLLESTSGYPFVAWMDENERSELIAKQSKLLKIKINARKLNKQLDDLREIGLIKEESHFMKGITDIGVPITLGNDKNKPIATLCIPYASTSEALGLDETVEILSDLADFISSKAPTFGGF